MYLTAMLSRTAVVCMTFGFIILLSMVIIAVSKSNPSKQLMKGSSKTGQGKHCFYVSLFI